MSLCFTVKLFLISKHVFNTKTSTLVYFLNNDNYNTHTHTHIYVLTFLCSLLFFDPLAVCDYQEDKDKRGLFASEAGTSAISSPSPSDPPQTVYGNTMFPTSPRDSSSTASMAQLLTSL